MTSRYNLETLNAYVDGELSLGEKAEVANAIARNPELARQAATLSTLKATLSSSGCSRDKPLPVDIPTSVRKTSLSRVAAIVGIFMFGAVVSALLLSRTSLLPNEGLQLAAEAHRNWLRQETQSASAAKATSAALDRMHIDAYVPDLSKVHLAFSGVRRIATGNSRGMHIGYLGVNGCMVSLVVLNNTVGLSDELAYFERDNHRLYGWQVKQTGFYLLASKMDPRRLTEIARVVNRLTRERLPLDAESIIALEQAKTRSKSCLA